MTNVIRATHKTPEMNNVKLQHPVEKHFHRLSSYHYFIFGFIFLSKLPIFWHLLSLIFLAPPMDFYCNVTSVDEKLKNACPCSERYWDRSVFTETVQTSYNLACERKWLVGFVHSVLFFGSLIGSFLFGLLSDKFGRLSMYTLSCLIVALFGSLSTIKQTITSYVIFRWIEGIGIGGAIVTAYVLCVEYCGVNNREIITALFQIPLNVSYMTLSGISYIVRDCNLLQLVISVPIFFCVILKWMLMESPKWLMDSENDIDKATKVIKKASHLGSSKETIKAEIEEYITAYAISSIRKVILWEIFKCKKFFINIACMSAIYFICGMGYYGISHSISKMSADIHTNVALIGAIMLPGAIATIFLLQIFSRKVFLASTCFLSGILTLAFAFVPSKFIWIRIVLSCVCNIFIFMSFTIAFLYSVELFPTSVRNSMFGLLGVMSRAGHIVAPFVTSLPESVAGSILGVTSILGALFCYPLPETKSIELPSSLEDIEALTHKPFRSRTSNDN